MKKSILIFSSIIILAGFAAFGFANSPTNNNDDKPQNDSTAKQLPDFGINTNYLNGTTSQSASRNKNTMKNKDLFYMVRGYNNQGILRAITKEKLSNANSIADLIENYPNNWIKDYNSVNISTILNNKTITAKGSNASLTQEQKELLDKASELLITVHYQKKNYNDQLENREMNVSLIVTPKIEAEYVGGYEKMITYLEENSLDQIEAKKLGDRPQSIVNFTINFYISLRFIFYRVNFLSIGCVN